MTPTQALDILAQLSLKATVPLENYKTMAQAVGVLADLIKASEAQATNEPTPVV